MVKCETIAVTEDQTIRLRTAAKRRCLRSRSKPKKTKTTKKKLEDYFKLLPGTVPDETDADTSCANHRLVRVARGLRKAAGMVHESLGRVHFARGTNLAKKHPRGVACFMRPSMGADNYSKELGLRIDENTSQQTFSVAKMAYLRANRVLQNLEDVREDQAPFERSATDALVNQLTQEVSLKRAHADAVGLVSRVSRAKREHHDAAAAAMSVGGRLF